MRSGGNYLNGLAKPEIAICCNGGSYKEMSASVVVDPGRRGEGG